MRKIPMPIPEIALATKEEIEYQSKLNPAAKYWMAWFGRDATGTRSKLSFVNMSHMSEDECIEALLHEEDHWAQELYLDKWENVRRARRYVASCRAGKVPFTEWAMAHRCNYDYSEWEKKYGRKD